MNAVEIEEAGSALAERLFEGAEFPFAFLRAFGNKTTSIKRLRSGASNSSDGCTPHVEQFGSRVFSRPSIAAGTTV